MEYFLKAYLSIKDVLALFIENWGPTYRRAWSLGPPQGTAILVQVAIVNATFVQVVFM